MDAESVGRTLDYFVYIRVVKRVAREGPVWIWIAVEGGGGAAEDVEPPGCLALLEGKRDRDGAVGLDARSPEEVVTLYQGKGCGIDGVGG